MSIETNLKTEVKDFWDAQSCGEIYAKGQSPFQYYETHSKARYALEPYIMKFAKFQEGIDKNVLEIGVGMGADHIEWAKSNPKSLTGIDLTPRAVEHTLNRLKIYNLHSNVLADDAEKLPFTDNAFDLVYSWGVLHHSPDTQKAVDEVYRVLRPNGIARIMIYHKHSLTGYMLWLRYGLFAGRPFRKLNEIYANHLESPGTKAYSIGEAHHLFRAFSVRNIQSQLCFGDLLKGEVGQRHGGLLLTIAKSIYPRWLFKRIFKLHGLDLLIEAKK